MKRRAHRSAYVLLVRGLTGDEYRKAAKAWAGDSVADGRGIGSITRELRRRGVRWGIDEVLWIHYGRPLAALLAEKTESPWMRMLEKRAGLQGLADCARGARGWAAPPRGNGT